jgi:protein phosphatase 2C family protein 2/3
MGQTLSEPITHKETSKCENEFLKVGASCMQGWRISNTHFPNLVHL